MSTNILLELKSVSKSFNYGVSGHKLNVLDNLDLSVPQGKISAIIGGNGTGKTTLFNLISGFIPVDSGDILLNNGRTYRLNGMSPDLISRHSVGRLFQESRIFPELTIMENLLIQHLDDKIEFPFYCLLNRKHFAEKANFRRSEVEKFLSKQLGDDHQFLSRLDEKAGHLSFGEKRIMNLLGLQMRDYKLLMLDEPTAGLNRNFQETAINLIKAAVREKGTSVLIIEHNKEFVDLIADECYLLSDKKLHFMGHPDSFRNSYIMKKNYSIE